MAKPRVDRAPDEVRAAGKPDSGDAGASNLAAFVDIPFFQSMMDDFYRLTRIPMSLLDLQGNFVVGAGWQDVCLSFHRVNAETCANCAESDLVLAAEIPEGEARLYRCKNGMWDAATPVTSGSRRVATIFTGQFFFDDEEVDFEFFRRQARRYGFDEADYIAALEAVPRLSRSSVELGLRFLTKLAGMISQFAERNAETERAKLRVQEALDAEARIAAENARLYESEREASGYSEAMNAINRLVHSHREISEILRRVVKDARAILDAETAAVFRLDGEDIVEIASVGFEDDISGLRMPASRSPHGLLALESRQAVAIDDAQDDDRVERRLMTEYGIRSVLVVPLLMRSEPLGVLYFNYHSRMVHFSGLQIDFANKLAASMSLALENARLFEDERAARAEADAERARVEALLEETKAIAMRESILNNIVLAASSELRPAELVVRISETMAQFFGASQAQVRLIDETRTLLLSGGEYDPKGLLQQIGDMPVDADTETAATFRDGKPRIGESVGSSLSGAGRKNAKRAHVQSYILYPIKVGTETIGTLYMGWSEPRQFPAEELSFIEAAVAQFSIGLQNAVLYEDQRRRRRRIEALHEVLEIGLSSLDVHESAERILRYVTGHYDFDLANIWLASGDVLELTAQVGYPSSYSDLSPMRLSDPYDAVEVFKSGRTMAEKSPANPSVIKAYRNMGLDLEAYVVAPLLSADGPIGIVSFVWTRSVELNSYDIEFYDSLAAEIALVLENARLYQVEHNIAETLQQILVELPPRVPGLVFSRAYGSATSESGRVGGDFIDLFEVQGSVVGIVIGDVSGKGMEAAVVTSLVRNTVRAHAIDGLSPSAVCMKTNKVVCRFTDVNAYVTLFFGLLDTETGLLRYVGAGHPEALLLSDTESIQELDSKNPILGAFDAAQFHESETVLGRGERIVLYTDGVIEARSPSRNEFLGADGLKEALRELREVETGVFADSLMRRVAEYSEGILRDDAAILVVEPDRSAGG